MTSIKTLLEKKGWKFFDNYVQNNRLYFNNDNIKKQDNLDNFREKIINNAIDKPENNVWIFLLRTKQKAEYRWGLLVYWVRQVGKIEGLDEDSSTIDTRNKWQDYFFYISSSTNEEYEKEANNILLFQNKAASPDKKPRQFYPFSTLNNRPQDPTNSGLYTLFWLVYLGKKIGEEEMRATVLDDCAITPQELSKFRQKIKASKASERPIKWFDQIFDDWDNNKFNEVLTPADVQVILNSLVDKKTIANNFHWQIFTNAIDIQEMIRDMSSGKTFDDLSSVFDIGNSDYDWSWFPILTMDNNWLWIVVKNHMVERVGGEYLRTPATATVDDFSVLIVGSNKSLMIQNDSNVKLFLNSLKKSGIDITLIDYYNMFSDNQEKTIWSKTHNKGPYLINAISQALKTNIFSSSYSHQGKDIWTDDEVKKFRIKWASLRGNLWCNWELPSALSVVDKDKDKDSWLLDRPLAVADVDYILRNINVKLGDDVMKLLEAISISLGEVAPIFSSNPTEQELEKYKIRESIYFFFIYKDKDIKDEKGNKTTIKTSELIILDKSNKPKTKHFFINLSKNWLSTDTMDVFCNMMGVDPGDDGEFYPFIRFKWPKNSDNWAFSDDHFNDSKNSVIYIIYVLIYLVTDGAGSDFEKTTTLKNFVPPSAQDIKMFRTKWGKAIGREKWCVERQPS